jgi:hypothetical protein
MASFTGLREGELKGVEWSDYSGAVADGAVETLPAVEHGGLEPPFVTQVRDRHPFHQMPPQNGALLFRGVVLPLFFHVFAPLS